MLEKIALKKKLISKEDALKAIAACKTSGNYEQALIDYFTSNDLIPAKTIEQLVHASDAIKIMKSTMRFGNVAVKMGFISQKILEATLAIQKKSTAANKRPKLIGQILLENGKLTKQQIARIIKEQKRLSMAARTRAPLPTDDEPAALPDNKKEPVLPDEKQKGHARKQTIEKTLPDSAPPEPAPAEPDPPGPDPLKDKDTHSEKIEGGLILDIEDGGMTAYLKKSGTFDNTLIVEDIYAIAAARGIQFGLVNEGAIQGFINSKGFKKNRFQIATGTPPETGKNGRVEYYFETDHLKAGDMDEEGNIDFKKRGKIPKIEANTLLAEKFPCQEAKAGRDIFGNELLVEPTRDVVLKAGTGVLISDDGRYAHAEISGHPKLSWSGNLSVVDLFLTKGDVGYKTGHLIYDGNIEVKGCLKSGFRIKGYDIKIKEVDGGEIHAEGDITVQDGINGATIYARGHVSANYIHDSRISCLGNVYIEKEIVDSTIESSGACQVTKGKIINATICSNQGVAAKNIGTEKTAANMITVGQDLFIKKELVRIEKQIIESEKQKLKLKKKKENLAFENKGYHDSSTRTANELDKMIEEKQALEQEISRCEDDPDKKKERAGLKTRLKQVESHFNQLDKQLNDKFDEIEKNEEEIENIYELFDTLDDLVEDLNQERENYMDWSESNAGKSVVIATGKVFSHTIVQGKHAQKEIRETVSNVKIAECRMTGETDDTELFEIQVHDNIKKR